MEASLNNVINDMDIDAKSRINKTVTTPTMTNTGETHPGTAGTILKTTTMRIIRKVAGKTSFPATDGKIFMNRHP